MSKTDSDIAENKKFSLILALALVIFGAVIPLIKGKQVHVSLFLCSLFVFLLGQIRPLFLSGPRLLWIKFGNRLGKINSAIIYTVIYIVLFSFIHFIFVLIRRDKMLKRWKHCSSTLKTKDGISNFQDPF